MLRTALQWVPGKGGQGRARESHLAHLAAETLPRACSRPCHARPSMQSLQPLPRVGTHLRLPGKLLSVRAVAASLAAAPPQSMLCRTVTGGRGRAALPPVPGALPPLACCRNWAAVGAGEPCCSGGRGVHGWVPSSAAGSWGAALHERGTALGMPAAASRLLLWGRRGGGGPEDRSNAS